MANIHLPKRTKAWINCVGAGVWISGVGWLIAHYFLKPPEAFGPQVNPSEMWWLKLHGAFAFLALWTGGMLWGLHIVKAWRRRRHRWSGGALFTVLLVVMASGYLLYYVGEDSARELISQVHWMAGLAIPLAYLMHRIAKHLAGRPERPANDR